jgi:hypothetical protein
VIKLAQPVDVRCPVSHHSIAVTTEIPYPDVISKDDKNVRLYTFFLGHCLSRLAAAPALKIFPAVGDFDEFPG